MFDFFCPRTNPSLPQNDTPEERKKRQRQLEKTGESYVWDLKRENVVGVPMARDVPRASGPTLTWFAAAAEVAAPIIGNILANIVSKDEFVDAREGLSAITKTLEEIIPGTERLLLKNASGLADTLISTYKETFEIKLQKVRVKVGLKSYNEMFKCLALPEIASVFQTNESFARYRVAGPNPMLLKGVSALEENFPVTEGGYQKVMGADDSLAGALSENRIYVLDYQELTPLAQKPGGPDKQVFAPIALFAIAKGGKSLIPVAIQSGQNKDDFEVVYSMDENDNSPQYWRWQVSKTVLQVADANYHEFFIHLSRTHLVMEAFTIATRRCLAETHPVNILLSPHFEGTLFINNSAAETLIAPGGPIDSFFGADISAVQAAAGGDRLGFDFYENMLPRDLARRKVDNPERLPDYPYRDDALLIWKAIHDWTVAYVGVYYGGDDAVLADTELTAWTKSLRADTEGRLKGFELITTREQLADVLTMVIFTCSAQHAAVNFPQKPLMSYAPASSGAIWGAEPEKAESDASWLDILPPLPKAMEQLSILQLLGGVYYRKLGEYRSNTFPYLEWFEDDKIIARGGPLDQFNEALAEIETTIHTRNKTRQEYSKLLPSRIPPSINI